MINIVIKTTALVYLKVVTSCFKKLARLVHLIDVLMSNIITQCANAGVVK